MELSWAEYKDFLTDVEKEATSVVVTSMVIGIISAFVSLKQMAIARSFDLSSTMPNLPSELIVAHLEISTEV